MAGAGTKLCITCASTRGALPITEFHYKNAKKGTRQDRCKECAKEYAKKHYSENKEKRLEQINERQKGIRIENRKLYNDFLSNGECSVCSEDDARCLTSGVTADELTYKTTDDLKLIIAQAIIKCLNCQAKV